MGFSKFEFRPTKSFQYMGGGGVWDSAEAASDRHSDWTVEVARMQIWVLRSNFYIFGNISIISGILQIDRCKVTCVYSKCICHSYQPLYFTLDCYTRTKQKSYFSCVKDSALLQINLKKETWIACVLLCQPVVVDPGTFRDLPRKLHYDRDLQTCWAEGKLHAQVHTGRVR
jgi:hypothetical protein